MLQAQTSPTTGKLHTLGGANENDPTRFEVSQLEDSHCAFSFRHSELKPSHYTAEEKMESLSNNRHPSLPSTEVTVKTEANIQTALGTDLPSQSHLMQQQFHGQTAVKSSGSRICNFSHPSPDTVVADGDGASPPDHGQPTETTEGDAKVDCAAIVAAAPAEDGYSWRKYGQKQVKHSEYPRSYYKCTHPNCVVKKKVERSHQGHVTEIIYKGTHNHAKPLASRRPPGDTQMDHASPDGSNPHAASGGQPNVEARPLWHNGVVVQDRRVEGVEATSFPSVPGELSDSAASMQVDDGSAARRFESPEGVDATSAVSDEVERDDGGTHATMPQAAADGKSDELERKRRKLESCAAIEMSTASRAVREPRVVIQTTSEFDILDDGYRWRKYGQKVVKGNPNPRSYYKCTHPGCLVRKHVERASHDLKSVITTYEGKHNHEVPAARNSGHPVSAAPGGGGGAGSVVGSLQLHSSAVGSRRPELPSMQDSLMRLPFAPFGLRRMGNFPYPSGHAASLALPSIPLPAGLSGVDGLNFPMLAPPVHQLFRHRQGVDTAGLMVPKGEVKEEAMPANSSGAGAGAGAVYPQAVNRLPMGHQL
ncbi:hypothetical protein GUJ93_ZPchr0014g46921 [Zizania palustris]|uniref:WRKY transcription factor WRKY24 n=1 Tax=Zizania palustris TaxID=103762 RepID=A0A8J5VUY9_ZIZPA|nr:hypothetical protein GUJ93_ZPchr0014g46921 [Zizania palustris]